MNSTIRVTPRKIVVHVLMDEIRHWPQVAALLRLNGIVAGFSTFRVEFCHFLAGYF